MSYNHKREPVENTCPAINRIVDRLDVIKSWGKDIMHYCELAEDEMEDLRRANEALRCWGNDEAEKVDEFEYIVSELEIQIEELKDKIKSLEKELNR